MCLLCYEVDMHKKTYIKIKPTVEHFTIDNTLIAKYVWFMSLLCTIILPPTPCAIMPDYIGGCIWINH